jgi:hypothetical protein
MQQYGNTKMGKTICYELLNFIGNKLKKTKPLHKKNKIFKKVEVA